MSDIVLNGKTYSDVEHVIYNGSEVNKLYVNGKPIWFTYDPVLANNSWDTISMASRSGVASSLWNLGDQITISLNGVSYTVDIIGFNHDIPADIASYGRDRAGITFHMHDTIESARALHSDSHVVSRNWTKMDMYTSGLPNYFNELNNDLKSVIVPVVKSNYVYYPNNSIVNTVDSLFLLSTMELNGSSEDYDVKNKEGTQYEYYAYGNSIFKNQMYWTRTDSYGNSESSSVIFDYVNNNFYDIRGVTVYYNSDIHISFAFCV